MIDPVCECSCGNVMDLSDGNGIRFKCQACITCADRRWIEIVDDEESYSRVRYMFIKGNDSNSLEFEGIKTTSHR